MTVDFKCKTCGFIKEIEYDVQIGPPKELPCDKCDGTMKRSWAGRNKPTSQVDEWFGDQVTTAIAGKMKTSRPSGKTKNIY